MFLWFYLISLVCATNLLRSHNPHLAQSIPILSVSLTADPNLYLLRLLRSIDYPVNLILITLGNRNITITRSLSDIAVLGSEEIQKRFPHTKVCD